MSARSGTMSTGQCQGDGRPVGPDDTPFPTPGWSSSVRLEGLTPFRDRIGRGGEVALAGEAGAAARAEVVVAVGGPVEPDRSRQAVALHFVTAAEGIALALDDQ